MATIAKAGKEQAPMLRGGVKGKMYAAGRNCRRRRLVFRVNDEFPKMLINVMLWQSGMPWLGDHLSDETKILKSLEMSLAYNDLETLSHMRQPSRP
jgi:hypothetical protein